MDRRRGLRQMGHGLVTALPPAAFSVTAAVALVALTMVLAVPNAGAVLCVKRKGVVVSREECRRKETPLPLDGLLTPGEKGDKGDPGPPGEPGSFRIVDADGQTVGYLVSLIWDQAGFGLVFVPLPDGPLFVFAASDGFVEVAPILAYESGDCTGTPFIPWADAFGRPLAFVAGGTVYRADGPPAPRTIMSHRRPDETCQPGGTEWSLGGGPLAPGATLPAASLGKPPFSLAFSPVRYQ